MKQEREILEMLHTGRRQGMEALFARFYKPLVVFAGSYLHDLQESEDLVQDSLVNLWTKEAFRRVTAETLSSFLFTVVKNACINRMKKKKLPLHTLELPHFRIAQEEASRFDENSRELVVRALEKLPARTRKVVEYVMLEERMYKETAEELGVSVNTVKTLLRQGLRELREQLKGYEAAFYWLWLSRSVEIDAGSEKAGLRRKQEVIFEKMI